MDLLTFLKETSYPGRGIVIGSDRAYYFIMGRSENSRNRVFVPTEDGIRTEAHDPAKLTDPSLIIYHPVRTMGDALVITNGDQTDTICRCGDFRRGLMTRSYEPDEPNWTPRISAIRYGDGAMELSILKRCQGRCLREFFCYEGCDAGRGFFISTYQGDGSPLPTFAGEPKEVELPEPEALWAALNMENKVSLYANVGGEVRLFNKNLGPPKIHGTDSRRPADPGDQNPRPPLRKNRSIHHIDQTVLCIKKEHPRRYPACPGCSFQTTGMKKTLYDQSCKPFCSKSLNKLASPSSANASASP